MVLTGSVSNLSKKIVNIDDEDSGSRADFSEKLLGEKRILIVTETPKR